MARGGGSYDDIVKAVMAVVNAGKSVADDVSGIAAAAKSAVKSALGKPPKVTIIKRLMPNAVQHVLMKLLRKKRHAKNKTKKNFLLKKKVKLKQG
jgi:histidyl-tRNA synthetase